MLEQIEEVSIDLWLPYKNLVKELMPSAEVVADRFHVMKQINQELDEQRKAEKRAVEAQKNKKQKAEKEAKLEVLKRSKYSLLKNEEDLTEPQKIKLEAIKEKFPNLKKMQELKEEWFFGLCYVMDGGYKRWNPYRERHWTIFVNCF